MMRVRRAVRRVLHPSHPTVLVALSGGADSLALAAAVAAESAAAKVRAGAVIVDHALQEGSAEVAARAAVQAEGLGLSPVIVRRVSVEEGRSSETGGLESAARTARYEALAQAAAEAKATCVLTAHTRDDQSEQVLLGLARGSGTRSIAGIPVARKLAEGVAVVRPLLDERDAITREITEAACAELDLEPWQDPHNTDPSFARVRVRREALPNLERLLGPGVADALARSADLAREDADALDRLAREWVQGMLVDCAAEPESDASTERAAVTLPAQALATLPDALRNRAIRIVAAEFFASRLTREHTLSVAALASAWKGQGPVYAPGLRVTRIGTDLRFEQHAGSPRA